MENESVALRHRHEPVGMEQFEEQPTGACRLAGLVMPAGADESMLGRSNIDGGPIRELVARYVESVALFDVELYRSVWTHDAVWEVDGRGHITGPDEITKLFVRLRGRQEMAVQRVMSGRAITEDGHGVGRWVIHSLTRTDGQGEELVGIYDDRYRLDGNVWRFLRRAFSPLYRGPHDLPGRVWSPPPPQALRIDDVDPVTDL